MAENSRISAAAAAASSSSSSLRTVNNGLLMENLRAVNTHLLKEAILCRKQINHLQSQLSSIAADKDFLHEIQRDVMKFVISSSVSKITEKMETEMASATERERHLRDLTSKTELAFTEINATEMWLLDLITEKEKKEKELAEVKESLASLERAKEGEKRWRKWLYPAAATSISMAVAWALFTFCKSSKN